MSKKENVAKWESESNPCYEYQCHNDSGALTIRKRDNATDWEDQSNACYEYQCHNDSGPLSWKRENASIWESKSNACYEYQCYNGSAIYWKQCNNTEEAKQVCENDQCVEIKSEKEEVFTILIEVEGIDVTDYNMTEIRNAISDLTNIEADRLRIRVNMTENDEVLYIIIIPDNKTAAEIIYNILYNFSYYVWRTKCVNLSDGSSDDSSSFSRYCDGFLKHIMHADIIGDDLDPTSYGSHHYKSPIGTIILIIICFLGAIPVIIVVVIVIILSVTCYKRRKTKRNSSSYGEVMTNGESDVAMTELPSTPPTPSAPSAPNGHPDQDLM